MDGLSVYTVVGNVLHTSLLLPETPQGVDCLKPRRMLMLYKLLDSQSGAPTRGEAAACWTSWQPAWHILDTAVSDHHPKYSWAAALGRSHRARSALMQTSDGLSRLLDP